MPKKRRRKNKIYARQYWGFFVAGAVGFLVDATLLTGGTKIGLPVEIARAFSFVTAVLATWSINRTITFLTPYPASIREFLKYLVAMALGLTVNLIVYFAVYYSFDLPKSIPSVALVPATLAGMTVNFVNARLLLR